jgi:hypothetical protein
VNDFYKNIFFRLVDLVNIQVEIIIDDITGSGYKNGRKDDPGKCTERGAIVNRRINTKKEKQLGEDNK